MPELSILENVVSSPLSCEVVVFIATVTLSRDLHFLVQTAEIPSPLPGLRRLRLIVACLVMEILPKHVELVTD
jgi:hypothetical protein